MKVLLALLCVAVAASGGGVCDVTSYGASSHSADNQASIQKALDDPSCSEVLVPSHLSLKSGPLNVTRSHFVFSVHGTLRGIERTWNLMPSLPSYPCDRDKCSRQRYNPFVFLYNAANVTLTGSGTIDGSGKWWWKASKHLLYGRPRLVEVFNCSDVTVSSLKLEKSPFWTLHLVYSRRILVDSVSVYNPMGAPNTDGIDVDSSQHVLISRCTIHTSDDIIAIKSGMGDAGRTFNMPSSNVTVENCDFRAGAGLAIGSETAGGVENVRFESITLALGVGNAVRLKAGIANGGFIQNVLWKDIRMEGVVEAVFANTCYECSAHTEPAPRPTLISGIVINNLHGEAGKAASAACTTDIPCHFELVDWDVTSVLGWTCSNVSGSITGGFEGKAPCFK